MEIITERLIIRTMKEEDLFDIYEYSKKSSISQYMYSRRMDDINQIKKYLLNCINQDKIGNKDIHSLSIVYNKKVIGEIALLFFDEGAELFWIINEDYQNQGFGYEASFAYINYIKKYFSIERLRAHCDVRNIPSKKLIEKLGFQYLGVNERIYPDDRLSSEEYSYELVIK